MRNLKSFICSVLLYIFFASAPASAASELGFDLSWNNPAGVDADEIFVRVIIAGVVVINQAYPINTSQPITVRRIVKNGDTANCTMFYRNDAGDGPQSACPDAVVQGLQDPPAVAPENPIITITE